MRPRRTRLPISGSTYLRPQYGILSEMRAGFQIGAVIFLLFLLDRYRGRLGDALHRHGARFPRAMVSAPFKILLFVLVDGLESRPLGSLMKGFFA